ncbi:MAG: hypothetical protein ABH869_03720 [Candidatus Omnitrophota bacterium]
MTNSVQVFLLLIKGKPKIHNKFIKFIAIILGLSIFLQNIVWADSTLQPATIFTGLGGHEAFLTLSKSYLTGIEDDPRNHNLEQAEEEIMARIEKIKAIQNIPIEFINKITVKSKKDWLKPDIVVDLGKYKIRYFNPNIPGTEIPHLDAKNPGIFYDIISAHVGRYLTSQVLISKALPAPSCFGSELDAEDRRSNPDSFGPALYYDMKLEERRELTPKEHKVLNEVCNGIVGFGTDQQKEPLQKGDLVYDFFHETKSEKINIYPLDNKTFENSLYLKGCAYLAEGLISHVGTYREDETRKIRAYNCFIPQIKYEIISEILKRREQFPAMMKFLRFWRKHEIKHFEERNKGIDEIFIISQGESFFYYSIYININDNGFLGNGAIAEIFKQGDEILEKHEEDTFLYYLLASIYEKKKMWKDAWRAYTGVVKEVSLGTRESTDYFGNRFIDKAMEILDKVGEKQVLNYILTEVSFLTKVFAVSDEERNSAEVSLVYFGIIPVLIEYLSRNYYKRGSLTPLEISIVDKLAKFAEDNKIDDIVKALIFHFTACRYLMAKDFDTAIDYCKKSLEANKDLICAVETLSRCLVKRDGTFEAYTEAQDLLAQAEQSGLDISDSTKLLEKEEELVLAHEEALELYNAGKYQCCFDCIIEKTEGMKKNDIPVYSARLKEKAKSELRKINQPGVVIEKEEKPDIDPEEAEAKKKMKEVLRIAKNHYARAVKLWKHNRLSESDEERAKARKALERIPDDVDTEILNQKKEIKEKLENIQKIPGEHEKNKKRKYQKFPKELDDTGKKDKAKEEYHAIRVRRVIVSEKAEHEIKSIKNVTAYKKIMEGIELLREIKKEDLRRSRPINVHANIFGKSAGEYMLVYSFDEKGVVTILSVEKKGKDLTNCYGFIAAGGIVGAGVFLIYALWRLSRQTRINFAGKRYCKALFKWLAFLAEYNGEESVFGPGLFFDTEEDKIRSLRNVAESARKSSEHKAVNEVCNELIFQNKKMPLAGSDGLLTFIKDELVPLLKNPRDISVYIMDDAQFKEKSKARNSHFSFIFFGIVPMPDFIKESVYKSIGRFWTNITAKMKKIKDLFFTHLTFKIIQCLSFITRKDKVLFGPALFVDFRRDEIRCLEKFSSEEGRFSEDDAVCEVFQELVFNKNQKPLENTDPLCVFVRDFLCPGGIKKNKINMYIIDDAEFEKAIDKKGYGYLAQGFIDYIKVSNAVKKKNLPSCDLFLTYSIYNVLSKLLETKKTDRLGDRIFKLWLIRQIMHSRAPELDFSNTLLKSEKKALKLILFLSKAVYAVKKGELRKASNVLNKAIEIENKLPFIYEIRGKVNEKKRDFNAALDDYLCVLGMANTAKKEIQIGHPFEKRILQAIKKANNNNTQLVFKTIIFLIETFQKEEIKVTRNWKKNSEYIRSYFAFLPAACGSIDYYLQKGESPGPLITEAVDMLIALAENGKIVNILKKTANKNILSYIYYLAGKHALLKEDYDRAVKFLKRSIKYDKTRKQAYPALAITVLEANLSRKVIEEAREILEQTERKFGSCEELDKAKEVLSEKEEIVLCYEAAHKIYKSGNYAGCKEKILEFAKCKKVKKKHLPSLLKPLKDEAVLMHELKQKAMQCFDRAEYDTAKITIDDILSKNPEDEEMAVLKSQLSAKKEEKRRMVLVGKQIQDAKKNYLHVLNFRSHKDEETRVLGICGDIQKMLNRAKKELVTISDCEDEVNGIFQTIDLLEQKINEIISMPYIEVEQEDQIAVVIKDTKVEEKEPSIVKDMSNIEVDMFFHQDAVAALEDRTLIHNDHDLSSLINAVKGLANISIRIKKSKKLGGYDNYFREIQGKFRIIYTWVEGKILVRLIEPKDGSTYEIVHRKIGDDIKVTQMPLDAVNIKELYKKAVYLPKESDEIIKNAKEFVIPLLIQAMIDVSVKKKGERVVLFLDEDLAGLNEGEIKKALKDLIRSFSTVEDNNEELKRFLTSAGKMEIVKGKGSQFSAKTGMVKPENVIVITKKSSLDNGHFTKIEGKGIIAAINDDINPGSAGYLPLPAIVLFSLGKYLEWDQKTMREIYEKIPNAVPIEALINKYANDLFEDNKKCMIIQLIPGADSKTKDIAEAIRIIQDILKKA